MISRKVLSESIEEISKYFHSHTISALTKLPLPINKQSFSVQDYVVGKAVRTMGPDVVLSHIPLGITGNEQTYEFPRSWLLPVLRENVQKTKLIYFKSYFLPIATACYLRAQKAKKDDDKTLQKTYEVIVSQIW